MKTGSGWARKIAVVAALVWMGMLLGVSFLATPAKFLAPSLTLPVALDVGRQTFGIFSVIEVIASLILISAVALSGSQRRNTLLSAVIVFLVAAQFFWALPALDARVEIFLQGATPQASSLHEIYIAIEFVKLVILGVVAWSTHVGSPGRKGGVATNAH